MSDEVFGLDEINNRKIEIDPNFFSKPKEKETLEKEAEEKAIEVYGSNSWSVCAYKNGYLASAKPRDKKIAELESQNKKIFDDWLDACDKYGIVNLKLTRVKEIIKELVRVEYADFTNGDYSNELSKVLEQAEHFLNSEVEK